MMKYKSFTLIELLIIIVIIGILVAALVPKIQGVQNKARWVEVEHDIRSFRVALFVAQSNTNQLSCDITKSGCSACACRISSNLRTLPDNHVCRTTWLTTLRNLEQAAGMNTGDLTHLEKDPRGSPYVFDEDEGKCYSPLVDPCSHKDYIGSVGPDGLYQYPGYTGGILSTDDKYYTMNSARCSDSY